MFSKALLILSVFNALLLYSSIARAGTDIVILTAAGEAYNGMPRFRVLADDTIIGVGEIPNAVDTSNGSSLPSFTDSFENKIARFVFSVPSLKEVKVLDIEFYNDTWAGEGKQGNRNLYVIGVTISLVDSTPQALHIKTIDFGPSSFAPLGHAVQINERWAKLDSNGRLRLERPTGGWLTEAMTSSVPQEKGAETGMRARLHEKKEQVSAQSKIKSKILAPKPENKGAITGSLPPTQKKKAAKTATTVKQEESTKPKKSAAVTPADTTAAEPESPEAEPKAQVKPPNYSRYALPKDKCRRIGEKGTDRLC